MDGLSVAASIVGIATAGVQISIKLVTLATQISTASDSVSSIGNEISLTSGVLQQLGQLITQKTTDDGISILNRDGLETTRRSAAACERIFKEIEKEVQKASGQLRRYRPGQGGMSGNKIKLSRTERAKWPFLQPNIKSLRADLRDAKSTLMLMLQVASLALSKRMADASLSTREHLDFVRAIVALELQQREDRTKSTKQGELLSISSSNDTPNDGTANTRSPGEGTLELDPFAIPGVGRSRGLETQIVGNLSLPASPGSTLPWTEKPRNGGEIPTIDSSYKSPPSDGDSETQTNHNTELELYSLNPVVKDLFDRIELRWTVENTNVRPLAIREHMAENEKNDLPSVVEMLQQLHAYEQAVVDSETSRHSGGSVLSLKRTKTDIRSRDMFFKAVPGLQFVVQRQVRQPPPLGSRSTHSEQALPHVSPGQSLRSSSSSSHYHVKSKSRRNRLASVFTFLKPFTKSRKGTETGDSMQSSLPPHAAEVTEPMSMPQTYHQPEILYHRHNSFGVAHEPSRTNSINSIGEELLAARQTYELDSGLVPAGATPFRSWTTSQARIAQFPPSPAIAPPQTRLIPESAPVGRAQFRHRSARAPLQMTQSNLDRFKTSSNDEQRRIPHGGRRAEEDLDRLCNFKPFGAHFADSGGPYRRGLNQEHEDAEAMVTGLLGKYTTLFDS